MNRANSSDKNKLKVVYKSNHAKSNEPFTATGQIQEMIEHFLHGFYRTTTAFQHVLHRYSFGVLGEVPLLNVVKVSILGIIMFIIWKGGIAFDSNGSIFASSNKYERTHDSHYAQKVARNDDYGKMSFDLAPASPEELHATQVKNYIERFAPIAVSEMDRCGIPASISMAQAIIESRAGASVLAIKNNNHFGIKCFSKTCPPGHCTNYTDDHHKDFFIKYADAQSSWRAHSQFLMKNRYRELVKYGKNINVWAKGLREFGYATDNDYDTKILAVIRQYDLARLDDL